MSEKNYTEGNPLHNLKNEDVLKKLIEMRGQVEGDQKFIVEEAYRRLSHYAMLHKVHWVTKVGHAYTVKVNVGKNGNTTMFDVCKPFDSCIEMAKEKFKSYGTDVHSVQILREDEVTEFNPFES